MDRVVIRCLEVLGSVAIVYHLTGDTTSSTTSSVQGSSMSLHAVLGSFMQWRPLSYEVTASNTSEGPKGELTVTMTLS